MEKRCNHSWKKIYYRKSNNGKQSYIKVRDRFICDKCEKIVEVKNE